MSEHVMQHDDPPSWCVLCGTFERWCSVTPCEPEPEGERWWVQGEPSGRVVKNEREPARTT